jgi:hypothetical protein
MKARTLASVLVGLDMTLGPAGSSCRERLWPHRIEPFFVDIYGKLLMLSSQNESAGFWPLPLGFPPFRIIQVIGSAIRKPSRSTVCYGPYMEVEKVQIER